MKYSVNDDIQPLIYSQSARLMLSKAESLLRSRA